MGGAPISLYYLIKGLDKSRYQAIVLCPKDGFYKAKSAEFFKSKGITVVNGPITRFRHTINSEYRGFGWLFLFRELMQMPFHITKLTKMLLSDREIKIVHINEYVLLPSLIIAKLLRRKVVCHVRVVLAQGHFGLRRAIIARLLNKFADKVICIDEDVANALDNVSNKVVIHNSLDIEEYTYNPTARERFERDHNVKAQKVKVGMVSKLAETKGVFDFVEAAKIIRSKTRNVHFFMVGREKRGNSLNQKRKIIQRILSFLGVKFSDDSIELIDLISQYELQENITILDFTKDVKKIYAGLDIVVFPSYMEGIGRSGFEAGAMSLPAIATVTSHNEDIIIDKKTGLLEKPCSPEHLSNAILELVSHTQKRETLGRNARNYVSKEFDYRKNGERLMNIYDKLIM